MTPPAAPLAGFLYNTSCEETMSDNRAVDAISTRFRSAFGEVYGERLERVVLDGSRASAVPKEEAIWKTRFGWA
jgi:hypothetical protein